MPTIAPIQAADLKELAALYQELTGKASEPALMQQIFAQITANPDYLLLGAKDREQRLVGSAMGILCLDIVGECRPFLVLENVIVSGKCRRQGIGSKLLHHIEQYARVQNCHYIMLVSLIRRREAHAFYEQNGYEPGVVQGYKKYLEVFSKTRRNGSGFSFSQISCVRK